MYRISCMAARAICRWGWCLVDSWLWRGGLEGAWRVAADLLMMARRDNDLRCPLAVLETGTLRPALIDSFFTFFEI